MLPSDNHSPVRTIVVGRRLNQLDNPRVRVREFGLRNFLLPATAEDESHGIVGREDHKD